MKIWSVICEYNPFHNGHKYMLDEMRQNGAEYIIACMSGNFTQRGDFALYDKYTRAKSALLNGADLVIELPVTYACAGAERFAYGGVYLLHASGCVDTLCFGSESGNVTVLENACHAVTSPDISDRIKHYLSLGQTFASARQNAVSDTDKSLADILRAPNNILGIEYLKALKNLHSPISPITIRRTGTDHDSMTANDNIASASMLRELICQSSPDYLKYIPENTFSVLESTSNIPPPKSRLLQLENAVLYRLRMMPLTDFQNLPDISEGLENRIYAAVRNGNSLDEIFSLIKCKRYTLSRIRRILMYAFLGITRNDCTIPPQYIKILGFNQNGRAILRTMRKTARLPVIMRYSDTHSLSADGQYLYTLESRCDDIFALSNQSVTKCGQNLTVNPVILK